MSKRSRFPKNSYERFKKAHPVKFGFLAVFSFIAPFLIYGIVLLLGWIFQGISDDRAIYALYGMGFALLCAVALCLLIYYGYSRENPYLPIAVKLLILGGTLMALTLALVFHPTFGAGVSSRLQIFQLLSFFACGSLLFFMLCTDLEPYVIKKAALSEYELLERQVLLYEGSFLKRLRDRLADLTFSRIHKERSLGWLYYHRIFSIFALAALFLFILLLPLSEALMPYVLILEVIAAVCLFIQGIAAASAHQKTLERRAERRSALEGLVLAFIFIGIQIWHFLQETI